jgi:formate hydrogenlyase transcriptional activator
MSNEIVKKNNILKLSHATIENSFDGVIWVNQNSKIVKANKTASKLLECAEEELLTKSVLDFDVGFPWEDYKTFWKEIKKKKKIFYETVVKPKKNQNFHTEATVSYIEIDQNAYICGSFRDISERKKAEESLLLSEEKFAKAFYKNANLMMLFDLETRTILDVNDSWKKLTRYNAKDIVNVPGKLGFALLKPEKLKQAIELLENKNKISNFEVELKTRDGQQIIGLISAEPIISQDKKLFIISMIDITSQKNIAEHLRRKNVQQKRLLQIVKGFSSILNIKEVMNKISEGAKDILEANGSTIYLLEADGKTLTPYIAIDKYYEKKTLATKITIDNSFTGQAVKQKKGLIINDAATRPGGYYIPGTEMTSDDRVIVAPFIFAGKVLGAMYVYRVGDLFNEEDLSLAETFSLYAAIALKNSQAYDELQQKIKEQNELNLLLTESEEKYHSLFDDAINMIHIINPEGYIIDVNKSQIEKLGYSKEEMIGKFILEIISPKRIEKDKILIKETLGNKKAIQKYETIVLTKSGKELFVELNATPQIVKGKIVAWRGILTDITDRKNAEEKLKESEEKYRLLFENMMNGFALHAIILNKKGVPVDYKFLEVNSAFEHLTGLKSKTIIGKKVTEVISGIEKDPADWISKYGKVALTGQEIRMEQYAQPLNKWYSVLAFCPRKGQFATIFEDVTERKFAEKKLKDSEEQIRLLLDSTAEAIYGLDLKGNCTLVNQACLDFLGYTSTEDLLGKNMHSLMHHTYPDGSPYHQKECQIYQSFIQGEQIHVNDEVLWRADGTSFPVEYWSFPITRDGFIIGSVVTFLDITDRRRVEGALKDSEEKYRNLVETSQDLIFKFDSAGCFTYLNPAWEKTLEYKLDELLGHDISEFKTPEQAIKDSKKFKSILTGQDTFGYETIYLSRSGEEVYLVCNARTLKDSYGKVTGIQGTAHNITQRKRDEETLKNTLIEIEQLKNRLQEENIYLQEEIKSEHNFGDMIGRSTRFHEILDQVENVAATDTTVLISGETGTGKELVARAIHNLSDRKNHPLVKVNCATLPANLIESELFGHEKGAFTGALIKKIGRFELADKGTIFLDEIGDLPLDLQAKLLRVLQENEFERLGNPNTLKVDARVITATNRKLKKLVLEGNFREDLFYRLNVFPVECPPLRERKEDIEILINHFLKKLNKKLGKNIDMIPVKVMNQFKRYNWPGNIRELENIIERAVIYSKTNKLELGDWFLLENEINPEQKDRSLNDIERQHIIETLEKTKWKVSGPAGAAEVLGLKPTTLFSKMKKLGIEKKNI